MKKPKKRSALTLLKELYAVTTIPMHYPLMIEIKSLIEKGKK